jgi:hypothetical protein
VAAGGVGAVVAHLFQQLVKGDGCRWGRGRGGERRVMRASASLRDCLPAGERLFRVNRVLRGGRLSGVE